jgi:hypothetical protein
MLNIVRKEQGNVKGGVARMVLGRKCVAVLVVSKSIAGLLKQRKMDFIPLLGFGSVISNVHEAHAVPEQNLVALAEKLHVEHNCVVFVALRGNLHGRIKL